MLNNIVSMISKSMQTSTVKPIEQKKSYNPFAYDENPFINQNLASSSDYGKNTPVNGGYFAGYIDGKPNIVGRRLFIEV